MFGSTSAGGSRAGMEAGEPDLDAKDNDTRVRDSGLDLSKEAAKGGKEFLELGDIQGQEFGSTEAAGSINREKRLSENQTRLVYEDQEDYVEGEEHANDDDAYVPKERKSAQGMGFAMSRFNMKDEMEEGKFSADGSRSYGFHARCRLGPQHVLTNARPDLQTIPPTQKIRMQCTTTG